MNFEQVVPIITGISTLALAIITGFYVYFTKKLVESSNKANIQNQQAIKQQIQAITAPFLKCSIYKLKDKLRFKLSNTGNAPAYDIDLFCLGHYHKDDFNAKDFIARDYEGKQKKYIGDEEGFYHIFDRIVYGYALTKSEVDAPFEFPKCPEYISILLQYRNMSGDNFLQLYWFFEEFNNTSNFYKLGILEPTGICISPRVDFEAEPMKLRLDKGSELPDNIKSCKTYQDFEKEFTFAISSGYFVNYRNIEDRGEWKNI